MYKFIKELIVSHISDRKNSNLKITVSDIKEKSTILITSFRNLEILQSIEAL